ncbi:MAG: serine protease [Acidobacteria bacterium]|nr:serine protease [Acidobacteriota bacterium]|tara:strand:- start:911 stop:2284 length:1374 start_codon:yes stop_codon:yes gene_type:complete
MQDLLGRFTAGQLFVILTALLSSAEATFARQTPVSSAADRPFILVAEVDAIIHPVSAEYMMQAIDRADAADAELIVFTLRTPGGLVESTRSITSRMISAETPVAVFVAPSGARAASAGFLITIAADVAAMAPGTHIGAAHPVSGGGQQLDETMSEKAASDVAAFARSLAAQRNRNVELAEQAVMKSRAFTEDEAAEAEPPLIDLVVSDLDDLLAELDGFSVTRFDGSEVVLRTAGARIEHLEMTWRQRVLSGIARPEVAYLLFSLGTLGLTIELWNPGAILPGVVGGLCLLLAFFAFQVLPVNLAGVALIGFGIGLLALEAIVTSFGLLAVGGIVSMVLGSLILIDSPMPELQVGLWLILPMTLALSAIVLFLARLAVGAQRRRAVTGRAGMVDEVGRALTTFDSGGLGRVVTHGEIWSAMGTEPIAEGDQVKVVGVDGLTLTVRRLPSVLHGGDKR